MVRSVGRLVGRSVGRFVEVDSGRYELEIVRSRALPDDRPVTVALRVSCGGTFSDRHVLGEL